MDLEITFALSERLAAVFAVVALLALFGGITLRLFADRLANRDAGQMIARARLAYWTGGEQ